MRNQLEEYSSKKFIRHFLNTGIFFNEPPTRVKGREEVQVRVGGILRAAYIRFRPQHAPRRSTLRAAPTQGAAHLRRFLPSANVIARKWHR